MNLPDIWGKGSLFAYSGLEGKNTWSRSIVGTLLGDRTGVLLHTAVRRQLHFEWQSAGHFEYDLVASDIIQMRVQVAGQLQPLQILFYSEDTLIGFSPYGLKPVLTCEGKPDLVTVDSGVIHKTCTGQETEYSAFLQTAENGGTRFVLAFDSESAACCEQKARKALNADLQAEINRKLEFFKNLPRLGHQSLNAEKAYYKCFSILKGQVYSSEGLFTTRWTTPDRLPHKNLWLWDSVYHSLANTHISPELAWETLMAVLDSQRDDGFIPLMAAPPGERTDLTQPPVLAWGFQRLIARPGVVGRTTQDQLLAVFAKLERYLAWNMANRDSNKNNLFEWKVMKDSITNRCGESGMDNSSRFDHVGEMDCIDFSCFMASEARCMAQMARHLGLSEKAAWWETRFDLIKDQINATLWDEEDGFYYDRVVETGNLNKIKAVSSFLPLFAGVCSSSQAARLVSHLTGSGSFNTELPIPSVAPDDPAYQADMWRGPVWLNYNYMIIQGLREYGFDSLAQSITDKTIGAVAFWYWHDGSIYEHYDCTDRVSPARMNRKGANLYPYDFRIRIQNVRDFGWTAALYIALVLEREAERSDGGV